MPCENFPYTAEQVVEAYRKHGVRPSSFYFHEGRGGELWGCGLTALAVDRCGGVDEWRRLANEEEQRRPGKPPVYSRVVRLILGVDHVAMTCFGQGFAGQCGEAISSYEDEEIYGVGHEARRLVSAEFGPIRES